MRVITLNLLAEEQYAQAASARDPVKMAIAMGVGGLLLCVVAGSVMGHFADAKRIAAASLKSNLEKLGGGQAAGTDTHSVTAMADDILAINHSRQLYAPQLALLKDLIPDSIQLQQVAFFVTQTLQAVAPAAPKSGATGETAKPARSVRPKTIEHLSLQLTGRIVSSRPEIEIDEFIQSLRRHSAFSSQVGEIKLQSISRLTASADTATPMSAQFMIDCQYKERQ